MARVMGVPELVAQGGYRFVAVCTWSKENPNTGEHIHQDRKVKNIFANLIAQSLTWVQHTFTFNLCGERTFLFTGLTTGVDDLNKFINTITHDASGNPTNIKVEYTPKNGETDDNKVEPVGKSFDSTLGPEPGGYRFVAKLSWGLNDDTAARNRISEKATLAQSGGFSGIDRVLQCDILVGEQTAWIVGFANGPDDLQTFISSIVHQYVIDARVSHVTSGPKVNFILEQIPETQA